MAIESTAVAGQLSEADERVLIDGVPARLASARIDVRTEGLLRGDGAFETVGVWQGRPFRLEAHLDRLAASCASLVIPAPDRRRIADDVAVLLDGVAEDAALRLYVLAGGTRVTMLSRRPRRDVLQHLMPMAAPWVTPADPLRPAGAKTLSYAANMAATRRAQQQGADDALLLSHPDGYLLEGPTFGLLFVARGVVHAPDTTLGIIDSISRRVLLEVARDHDLDILYGSWHLDALADAEEVIVSSSLRTPTAVARVGDHTFYRPSPVCDLLAAELAHQRRSTG